mmetsp:Transcript_110684/g.253559  ORF Transcript_110684/g.253559 Transcript_110684/m.253559 type:complete len:225 (-) Transcript_110684:486-1160(-)
MPHNHAPPAGDLALRIGNHLKDTGQPPLLHRCRRVQVHSLEPDLIVKIIENYARGLQSIPPGPAALLVESFHGLWDGVVHDEPDVMLIDPHPKSHCGHHNLNIIEHPLLLGVLPHSSVQLSVVVRRAHPLAHELPRHHLRVPAAVAVHHPALVAEPALGQLRDLLGHVLLGLGPHLIPQIGSVEAAAEYHRVRGHAEHLPHVVDHCVRCGGGKCQNGGGRKIGS